MSLSVDDFDAFHRAVHDRAPFDWQTRLLRRIVDERAWPRVLDLPTGSGKTTCIDIALFALALDAAALPSERWCPRRIAMVVDRRVVVDQAAERGRKLLDALITSTEPVVTAARDALASLAGPDEEPLGVFTLRGGIPKDDGWARTPDQPLVIASTVDQIGSRLLIQGYGVSRAMRPVHAGLAGNDLLLLLDEVHLSHPFKETLGRLEALRVRFTDNGLPLRFRFAFLSATPGESDEEAFRLTSDDVAVSSALGPRLHAKKPVRVVEVSGRDAVAARVAGEAEELLKRHAVVAAVVNRVDTALAVFGALKSALQERADVVLLTGRMRPLDRDDVLADYRSRIATGGRARTAGEARLVVVGTQCIEAGADFDFDAMVTESASLDALRQRFGRVDRLGEHRDGAGNGKAQGVIVHEKSEKDDPVYQTTIAETVKWLKGKIDKKRKAVDFGSLSLRDAPAGLLAPKAGAPMLLPAYLDLWSQTAPVPSLVPDPGLFLHGPRSGPEDVQVIWRADVGEDDLDPQRLPNLVGAVSAIRPSSLEAISLPFVAARRWLDNSVNALEGSADLEIKRDAGTAAEPGGRRALRWLGADSEIVDASGIRPGDTLVVPSAYGGVDPASKCFDPSAERDVPDLAERAALLGRGRPLLRLHPCVLADLGLPDLEREDPEAARGALAARAEDLEGWKRPWAGWLGKGRKARAVPSGSGEAGGWLVISGERVEARVLRDTLRAEQGERVPVEPGADSTTDDEESAFVGSDVVLDVHSRHVEDRARECSRRLGLSDELCNDLSLAAWLHDIGKADPRFQRMLRGGSEIAYYRDEDRILAKSGMASESKAEHRRAQRLSGYPPSTRHEAQSLAMIETAREQVAEMAHDLDLVMHLVASHHGHCRPFVPPTEDPEPVEVALAAHASGTFGALAFRATTSAHQLHRLDTPLADRFWSLVSKYGWLELCWLEAILRLADHRASEDEAGGRR